MSKVRGLGRGLGALIPELEEYENEGRLEVALGDIRPNPYQPRKEFEPERLAELAQSIREHGILQPVLLRRAEGGYELVAGERRLRAAEMAGLTKIPAVIGEFSEPAMMQIALVENLQREDLNPLEEAEAYRRLMDEFGLTQEEVARKVGKSRPAIANMLRLLNLPANVKEDLRAGRTTIGHARAILGLKDEEEQMRAWQEVRESNLTVRETEQLVKEQTGKSVPRETKPKRAPAAAVDPDLLEAEDRIRAALGTKVRILRSGNGGRIEIQYYSPEELDRILATICDSGG